MIVNLYTLSLENVCVRVLYFFNTINTYYLVSGISTYFLTRMNPVDWPLFIVVLAAGVVLVRISDFYPLFLIPTIPAMFFVVFSSTGLIIPFGKIVLVNAIVYFIILIGFMGIPESIVARDFVRVIPNKLWNVIFTIAPTTVSLSISLFFSTYLSFALYYKPGFNVDDGLNGAVFWIASLVGAVLAYFLKPRTFVSKFMKPPIDKEYFKRIVVLNIDGCRLDVFNEEDLPNIRNATRVGASFPNGLQTVYRALTNPAFASILTGTTPDVHGIKDNNFGQEIKVEGLPDVVSTILYGSMHVHHFSKKHWKTRIVSLPQHSVYKADAVVQKQLFDDLLQENDVRLFIMDYSEADFLAHTYGSKSKEYRKALRKIDTKIGEVFSFLKEHSICDDTAVIICSDHGVVAIDHSYLLFDAEKYVPFIATGKGIAKGKEILEQASIMDIGITIAYLLGVPYPKASRGRVFVEMLTDLSAEQTKEQITSLVNKAYYDTTAEFYDDSHPEVCSGDKDWWVDQFREISLRERRPLSVLDFGSGTGLVGNACVEAGCAIDKFICFDVSGSMLQQARKKLGGSMFSFTSNIQDLSGCLFDVVCVNSVLHHVHDTKQCARFLAALVKKEGYLLGSHEPNRAFFNNIFVRMLATIYKVLGGGFRISDDTAVAVNNTLSNLNKYFPLLSGDEILQTVENHSPIEQSRFGIDGTKGFNQIVLANELFYDFNVLRFETYTTAFIRKRFQRIPFFKEISESIFYCLFCSGNLIRYALQK